MRLFSVCDDLRPKVELPSPEQWKLTMKKLH
jgi:hypothetical protein